VGTVCAAPHAAASHAHAIAIVQALFVVVVEITDIMPTRSRGLFGPSL
jgi:hypothetical protein